MIDPTALLVHLRVVGIMMAVLVFVNLYAPIRFGWKQELARVSLLTRQVFGAHAIFLVLLLALFAALFLTCAESLLEPTRLSRGVLIGLTAFWGLRMLMQWFYYSPAIWRGDRFNTVMHGVFSLTWVYVTAVCAVALWVNLHGIAPPR
jgi:hypothetical protein